MRIRFEFIIVLIAVMSLSVFWFGSTNDDSVGAATSISKVAPSALVGITTKAQCGDGKDNDRDTLIDYTQDTGCIDRNDNDERNYYVQCDDGIDNDGDTSIDFPRERGCYASLDRSESANCSDSIDNDLDSYIDYPADPECTDGPDDKDE